MIRLVCLKACTALFFLATLFLSACSGPGSQGSQNDSGLSTNGDSQALISLYSQIANIESDVSSNGDTLRALADKIIPSKRHLTSSEREQFNHDFTAALTAIEASLDLSSEVKVPKVRSDELAVHLREIVEAHKQWALFIRAKFNSFFSTPPDIDAANRFATQADDAADREAVALIMAYKEVGLAPPFSKDAVAPDQTFLNNNTKSASEETRKPPSHRKPSPQRRTAEASSAQQAYTIADYGAVSSSSPDSAGTAVAHDSSEQVHNHDLDAVRASDPAAADRIANYCGEHGAPDLHHCRTVETASWARLYLSGEFPVPDKATEQACFSSPFPGDYVGELACVRYRRNSGNTGSRAP